ncbi:HNH endonuclease [Aquimarina sp. Aq107]|uniref:HNH endonuclease n=1 Tax=Aquimarina sp. Aq107 TaxID=1191912 RepID=UPI000D5575B7|nr:HNH endonuclease [Aquimarina sp. Aq107]
MIKLELHPKPDKLTEQEQKRLTDKYKKDGSSVWNKEYIKKAVFNLSNGKCCFSEISLNTNSTYLEIEHFYPKNLYPGKVMEWGNLLPSSKKCNGTKNNHNTLKEPIVNPFKDNPKDHLFLRNGRFYDKTKIGKTTINIVALNDRRHFVDNRLDHIMDITEIIDDFFQDHIETNNFDKYTNDIKVKHLNKLKGVFTAGRRKEQYAATAATAIIQNLYYKRIKDFLVESGFWDDELQELEEELDFCYIGEEEKFSF